MGLSGSSIGAREESGLPYRDLCVCQAPPQGCGRRPDSPIGTYGAVRLFHRGVGKAGLPYRDLWVDEAPPQGHRRRPGSPIGAYGSVRLINRCKGGGQAPL